MDTTSAAAPATVTAPNVIPAILPHPEMSAPLPRGASYMHHFEIKMISDGKRLWAEASAEGQAVLAEIRGESTRHADIAATAKANPTVVTAATTEAAATGSPLPPNAPAASPQPPAVPSVASSEPAVPASVVETASVPPATQTGAPSSS